MRTVANEEVHLDKPLGHLLKFERRAHVRSRIEPLTALLTDIYRERMLVTILNVSKGGLGIKVPDRFIINFPVLIECENLIILCNVRHCLKSRSGGYLLGLAIQKVVDPAQSDTDASEPR
jgi:hypothetical protein